MRKSGRACGRSSRRSAVHTGIGRVGSPKPAGRSDGPPASVIHTGEREQLTRLIRADLDTRLRQLPSYYRLTDFIVSLDPLPRTRLGKIQRHRLAALFEAGKRATDKEVEAKPIPIERMTPDDRQLLEDPVALHTWNSLAERFASVRLTPETNMSLELGVDSLEWMTMSLQLERPRGCRSA